MFDLCNSPSCRVCGHPAIRVDEVAVEGGLLLCECPRCDHRFTGRPRAAERTEVLPQRISLASRRAPRPVHTAA